MQITMTVNDRIYQACSLAILAEHYGLTPCQSNRRGWMFTGSVNAWRKLADDIDFNRTGPWTKALPDYVATRKSDSLHGRIDRNLLKVAA
jgi:hypothetical protein